MTPGTTSSVYDPTGFAGQRLYLDANVFIYAVEGFEPYDEFLRRLFAVVESSAVHVMTSEITLAEVLVAPLRYDRPDLASVYRELLAIEGRVEVLSVSRDILLQSAAIRARSNAKPIDAIHVATAMTGASDIFISDDRRLNPAPLTKMTLEELAS